MGQPLAGRAFETGLGRRRDALAVECGDCAPPVPGVRRSAAAVVPALLLAALPKCPLCWAAYSGLLAGTGLGVVADHAVVTALLVVWLLAALAALLHRCWRLRARAPALAGMAGAALVLAGRLALQLTPLVLLGLAVLSVAAVAAALPRPVR
jgi:hypothetical protein